MTLAASIAAAAQLDAQRKAGGYDQVALDTAGRQGLSNGDFEDSQEEIPEIVEELFVAAHGCNVALNASRRGDRSTSTESTKPSLMEKLDRKIVSPSSVTV